MPERGGARLNEQAWPDDWTAAVIDQNNVIVARSRDVARFIGQPATESAQEGIRSGLGVFRAMTKEGTAAVVGAARVPVRSGTSRWSGRSRP